MNKCKGCIWSDKINNELVLCMFPSCVKKDVNKSKASAKAKTKRKNDDVSKKTSKAL